MKCICGKEHEKTPAKLLGCSVLIFQDGSIEECLRKWARENEWSGL